MGYKRHHVTIKAADNSVVCLTEPRGTLSYHIQYRLEYRSASWQSRQEFGSSRFVVPRFLELLKHRTFSIAITAWSAKVSSNLICFIRERPDLHASDVDQTNRSSFSEHRLC